MRDLSVRNQSEMKDSNIRQIIRTVLQQGPVSRSELCRLTGLTPPAVSGLTKILLEDGILTELGPVNGKREGAGRPPSLLKVAGKSHAAIGVEIGVSRLRMGTVNLLGKLLDTEVVEISSKTTVDDVIHRSVAFYRRQEAKLAAQGTRIVGIGVAVTGLVDTDSGISRFAPNLGWRNVNVKDLLVQQLGSPVIVDNNVRLMALGEEWFGRARNSGSIILVQVGYGVGCGIVLPKLGLLQGSFNGAGEFGHCTILPGGPMCSCGKRGCLEALISERAIVGTYLQRSLSAPNSALPVPPENLTVNIIVRLAVDGDEVAQSVLREAAAFLGIGLANLVNIIQPTQIVFSGNAFALSPTTRGWIEESTYAHCFDQPKFKFSNATFRNYQGVVGSATAILEKELL